MLIIALVLALIGLVALVFAVVTSNELVAWVCIVASVIGVVLLIIDALRERRMRAEGGDSEDEGEHGGGEEDAFDYPEELPDEGEDLQDEGQDLQDEPSTQAASDATQQSAVSREDRAK
jgi:hypothetical protein